jgi:hypothetical protein
MLRHGVLQHTADYHYTRSNLKHRTLPCQMCVCVSACVLVQLYFGGCGPGFGIVHVSVSVHLSVSVPVT